MQWGIKTVLGIPISSPNVGRIVVTLYSHHDRQRDQDLVIRLMEEFGRVSSICGFYRSISDCVLTREFLQLMPSPKWKLVVDIGEPEVPQAVAKASSNAFEISDPVSSGSTANSNTSATPSVAPIPTGGKDPRIDEVVSLLGEFMPSDPSSPMSPYLSGFMSLRLLLLRPSRSTEEEELALTMLDSYSSYSAGGRLRNDIAVMLARDYMFLSQQHQPQQHSFLRLGHTMVPSANVHQNFSIFGGSSSTPCLQNSSGINSVSGAGGVDSMSIVSN